MLAADGTDGRVWADRVYRSANLQQVLKRRGFRSLILWKGARRGRSLTSMQQRINRLRSRYPGARVGHGFGSMANEIQGLHMRSIGLPRTDTWIGLANLCYNMHRLYLLVRQTKRWD